MEDEEVDSTVDDIISQLKNKNNNLKNVEKEYPNLSPDDVDDFVREHASKVVIDSSDAIHEQMEMIRTGQFEGKEIEAAAELLKAFNASVEILQKRKIADENNKTKKEVAELKLQKEEENNKQSTGNLMTREDLVKLLKGAREEEKKLNDNDGTIDV